MRTTIRVSLATPAVLIALVLAGCSSSLRASTGDSVGTRSTDPVTTVPVHLVGWLRPVVGQGDK